MKGIAAFVIIPMVFARSTKSIKLIAFLLPLTFIWSWAACSLVCSELIEHQHVQNESIGESKGEDRLDAFEMDGCPFTASAAVLETRQTVNAAAAVVKQTNSFFRPEYWFAPTSIYKSDLNQNSPPRNSLGPPLFLRHGAFRI